MGEPPCRVNRVMSEYQVVGMLDRRTRYEARFFERFDFEGVVRFFEHDQFDDRDDLMKRDFLQRDADPAAVGHIESVQFDRHRVSPCIVD